MKTFSFLTLGCRLNQAEEEKLRRAVLEHGFFVTEPDKADFLVVNTCSVTAVADRKTRQLIKRVKKENPKLVVIVTGCGAGLAKDYEEVSFWVSNEDKDRAIDLIFKKYALKKEMPKELGRSKRTRALLKIQDGCNNFCAYCIVPYLRGREVSLSSSEIIVEAKKLEQLGYRELVLSGVNVGKYSCELSGETLNLVGVIKKLLAETNFQRIRLSSVNPQDITDEMIALWAGDQRLARHLHLSLQSGTTSVLKRMGRPYSAEKYLSLSKKIVQKIPEMAITTDVIVGFPGETDEEFEQTVKFVQAVGFAKLHVFRYSPREGTRAAKMEGQVSEKIKTERSKKLLKIGKELERSFKEKFIGKELEVLFEENKNGEWLGLSTNYIRLAQKTSENLENQFKKVVVTEEVIR